MFGIWSGLRLLARSEHLASAQRRLVSGSSGLQCHHGTTWQRRWLIQTDRCELSPNDLHEQVDMRPLARCLFLVYPGENLERLTGRLFRTILWFHGDDSWGHHSYITLYTSNLSLFSTLGER